MSRRSRQLTYYGPPPQEAPEADPEPRPDALWGYTLDGLDGLASRVVRNNMHWWPAGDRRDQHDTAWEGIAGHLCEAKAPPSERDLLEAGRAALAREVRDQMRHRGERRDGSNDGTRFAAYWNWAAGCVPSPEGPAVERVALGQVLAALTPRQREALTALALHGDYWKAAAHLGIENQTFRALLGRARGEFRRLWFAPEAPPRVTSTGRRATRHETSDPAVLARRAADAARARARRAAAKGAA